MAKFNNLDQVKKEFLLRSNGGDRLKLHQARLSDLDNFAPIVERLLDTDYNKVSGFSFSELMEAVSLISENYGSNTYVNAIKNDSKAMKIDESAAREAVGEDNFWAISETLNTTTTAQAPYPVPSIGLTTYAYEKSVIPYLAHMFDLKGNRGLVYYQKITAGNAMGNINSGDLLGSPKENSAQPLDFAGTRNITKEEVATLASGTTSYTGTLAAHPLQPGSLVINVDGLAGYFKDFAQEAQPNVVALYAIGGDLGTATVNFTTGAVTVALKTAPATSGGKIYATYCREVENVAGKDNIAKAQFSLESKQLEAEDFSILTETSIYQEALSKAIFGQDWNSLIDEGLAAIYNKEVGNKIVAEIKAAIPAGSIKTHSLAKSSGGNNDWFNVSFISVVMGELSKMINKASGIGGNKLAAIVANIDLLPIFRALPKFTAAQGDFEEVMGGLHVAGLYDGTPVVMGYEPILASGEMVGLYKSKSKDFLAPYAWGTFILPIIRDVFDNENLSVGRKQLISSAAGAVVAENLASKVTVTDISTVLG